jgi:branched-chain amino acid aminotransferase
VNLKKPTVVIAASPFTPYPKRMYQRGVSLKIAKIRQNENSPLSGMKSASFLDHVLARMAAKRAGFDDALLLNSRGQVTEAAISNVFLVKKRQLITPSLKSGALPGITRAVIMKLAPKAGLKVKEAGVITDQLYNSDELFLTNSLMEVMPVVRVGNRVIGNGAPGIFTKQLHSEYKKLTSSRL